MGNGRDLQKVSSTYLCKSSKSIYIHLDNFLGNILGFTRSCETYGTYLS